MLQLYFVSEPPVLSIPKALTTTGTYTSHLSQSPPLPVWPNLVPTSFVEKKIITPYKNFVDFRFFT